METKTLNNFRRLAQVSTLTTYFLIFIGGLVRVSGAGLGCPDWPKCFGRWIPPLSRQDIPAGFNPDLFNFTLAWIEYINRLVGMIVGLLILATAIMAIIYFRPYKRILWPSAFAAVLVAFQGWYGSVVVASQLHPETVTIHMVLALFIVSLLVYVTQSLNYLERNYTQSGFPLKKWMIGLWLITIVQIILGTQLRAAIENLLNRFPLLNENELLSLLNGADYIHSFAGMLMTGITVLIVMKVFALDDGRAVPLRFVAVLALLLIILQIAVGSGMEIFGVLQILQVFHLWIASLFVGLILILYVELKHNTGELNG